MRIIINSSTQRFGGSVQVALSFIYECIQFPENEYHVWTGPGIRKSLNEDDFPKNFVFYNFDFGVISLSTTRVIQKTLAPLAYKIDPDVIIATSGPSYLKTKYPQIIGFNLPLYIYPESPYILGLPFAKKLKLFLRKQAHYHFFKKEAAAYVAQTDDVTDRVKKALHTDEVYTVTNTYNHFYNNPPIYPNKLPDPKPNEVRLLTISSFYSHKNLEIIPKVLNKLKSKGVSNVRFVVTLKDEDFRTKIGHREGIINVGPVNPEECPSLYNECDIMFLPTLAECFSASYPEAMIMKKPIITTDLGFARSICGEAALYYKPKDEEAAADVINNLINNKKLAQELVKKGSERLNSFDSARTRAEKYLEICKKISTHAKG